VDKQAMSTYTRWEHFSRIFTSP